MKYFCLRWRTCHLVLDVWFVLIMCLPYWWLLFSLLCIFMNAESGWEIMHIKSASCMPLWLIGNSTIMLVELVLVLIF